MLLLYFCMQIITELGFYLRDTRTCRGDQRIETIYSLRKAVDAQTKSKKLIN
jgi:hypothetical protein